MDHSIWTKPRGNRHSWTGPRQLSVLSDPSLLGGPTCLEHLSGPSHLPRTWGSCDSFSLHDYFLSPLSLSLLLPSLCPCSPLTPQTTCGVWGATVLGDSFESKSWGSEGFSETAQLPLTSASGCQSPGKRLPVLGLTWAAGRMLGPPAEILEAGMRPRRVMRSRCSCIETH